MYKYFFKSFFDFLISIVLLTLISPLIVFISILLYIKLGQIFFIQPRAGKNQKTFNLIKFKTMSDKKDSFGNLLPDIDRITALGAFLRKYSLDELPQLYNVIKFDMSIIGPRPLLTEYLNFYNEEQKKRHNIKPGITGWAQINGRNSITWEDKFKLDVWYVNNLSFGLDLKIFFLTILKILKREGINSAENTTMPFFKGE